jgi:hypothetical protein
MHPTLAAKAELQHKGGLRKLKPFGPFEPAVLRRRWCRQKIKSSKLYGNIRLAEIDAVAVETTAVAYVFKLSAG